jgi:type II secretory pathway component PulF
MSKFLKALILIVIFLIGAALIVVPFVYDMFDRTKSADQMMEALAPIVNTDHQQLLSQDAATLDSLKAENPELGPIAERLQNDAKTIGEQIDNFAAADKLPVRLAPWLMIALGAVIVILLLLRLALWKPGKKAKEPEPAAPATPAA